MASVTKVSDRVVAAVQKGFRERCGIEDNIDFEVHVQPVRSENEGDAEYDMMVFIWASLECPETDSLSTITVLLQLTHVLMHPEALTGAVDEIWDSLSSQRMVHAAGLSATES
jgi:hypothetical protein